MMASELARHGAEVRIIDKSPGIDPHVRANLLHSRTLEIFQSLGLSDRATEGSSPEHGMRVYSNGTLAGSTRHEPIDSPFPFGMSQSQAHVEATLETHLNAQGIEVERQTELTGLALEPDHLRTTITHPGGNEEDFAAGWLVGCDGAHSAVRHLSGCAFPGDADPYPYVLADVRVDGDLTATEGYLFLHDEGELCIFPRLPGGHHLVCANLTPDETPPEAPTLEQMQELTTRRTGQDFRLSEPRWLASFRIHYRLARHYRHGRTFLAGDAAHVHSLLGGQGMNTGIQDAYNLGWKLAAVAAGRAPAWWLDTYEAERRAIGDDVVKSTRMVTDKTELFASLSDSERGKLVAHFFAPEHERLKAARHHQEVDLDYRSSPMSLDPGGSFRTGPHAGAEAGAAAPVRVAGAARPFFELLGRPCFHVLFFQGDGHRTISDTTIDAVRRLLQLPHAVDVFVVVNGTAPENRLPDVATLIEDPEGALHARYGADEASTYLLRPDGYVAWRGRGQAVESAFARLFVDE